MKDVFELAREEVGTWEWKDGHNPVILDYFKDAGHPGILDDETAWCAAFVGAMLKRSGYKPSGSLLARSYCKWGEEVAFADIQLGDVCVIPRGNSSWQGHVFLYAGTAADGKIRGLGGNQRNQVNIKTFNPADLIAIRRAKRKERTSPLATSTLKAAGTAAAGTATTAGTVLGSLDPVAQYMVVGLVAVVLLALVWIVLERNRKFREGDT